MTERPEFHNPQKWYSRGYSPHYDAAEKHQMITYRLAEWQEDYWGRFIRDENDFKSSIKYISDNPVKAGLIDEWQNWPWSYVAKWATKTPTFPE